MTTWNLTATADDDATTAWDIALQAILGQPGIDDVNRLRNELVRVTADNGEILVFGLEHDDDNETVVGWSYACYGNDDDLDALEPYSVDGDALETASDIDTTVIATIRRWAADRTA